MFIKTLICTFLVFEKSEYIYFTFKKMFISQVETIRIETCHNVLNYNPEKLVCPNKSILPT